MANPAIVATMEVTGRTVSGPKYPKRMIEVSMSVTFPEIGSRNVSRTGQARAAGTVDWRRGREPSPVGRAPWGRPGSGSPEFLGERGRVRQPDAENARHDSGE